MNSDPAASAAASATSTALTDALPALAVPSDSNQPYQAVNNDKYGNTDKHDKPSRTGFLLREFAQTVAVEERDLSNSTDLLIIAADQVT